MSTASPERLSELETLMFRTKHHRFVAPALALLTLLGVTTFTHAGRTDGPAVDHERVSAESVRTYFITFDARLPAWVSITGDGDTDLDLYVYDENNNLVAYDDDLTDRCFARWRPRWTGTFRIEVVNHGRVYNDYVLRTN